MLRSLLFLAALLLAGLTSALAQRLVTREVALAAGQAVALDFKYAHLIRVRPGGKALAVKAEVTIADPALAKTYDLAVTTTTSEVRVEELLDKEQLASYWHRDWHDGHHGDGYNVLRIDYEVTLPAATPLTIKTIAGDIDAQDLAGAVTLKSVSGELTLTGLRGPVLARAISGNIRLTGLPGTEKVDAESVSGNIDASWPPSRAAELSLKSLSGEVYADSTVTFNNLKAKHWLGYDLHGHTGRGAAGPLVTLRTISGDVFFRKR